MYFVQQSVTIYPVLSDGGGGYPKSFIFLTTRRTLPQGDYGRSNFYKNICPFVVFQMIWLYNYVCIDKNLFRVFTVFYLIWFYSRFVRYPFLILIYSIYLFIFLNYWIKIRFSHVSLLRPISLFVWNIWKICTLTHFNITIIYHFENITKQDCFLTKIT